MSNKMRNAILGSCSLCVGAAVYVLYRPASFPAVFVAKLFDLTTLRLWLQPFANDFVCYYLADFLWALSLCCGMQCIWWQTGKGRAACYFTVTLCGTVWEWMQWCGIVPGTGDYLDISIYFMAAVVSVMINTKENKV